MPRRNHPRRAERPRRVIRLRAILTCGHGTAHDYIRGVTGFVTELPCPECGVPRRIRTMTG